MNRIEKTIKKNEKNLVAYFMAGQFLESETLNILHSSVQSGVNIIEIGFPFSDPTADGTTIQNSSKESLANGTTLQNVFQLVQNFRQTNTHTPIILMGYFNIIFNFGLENFATNCKKSGVDGLIIVDLPLEESYLFQEILAKYNIFLIQIVSFLTQKERFLQIQQKAKGFIYLTSSFGVTGQTSPVIEKIANYTTQMQPQVPIFVGFGISTPQITKEISHHCKGIVIGSHFIQTYCNGGILSLKKEIIAIKKALTG